jgi:general secretion pathway protein G
MERGFTLLEIMVVVVIIGLIAALAAPGLFSQSDAATRTIARTQCQQIHGKVQTWRMIKGRFPATLDEMASPLEPGGENFHHMQSDPWDRPFRMEIEGRKVRIRSNGPDGTEGTDDDLCYVPVDE